METNTTIEPHRRPTSPVVRLRPRPFPTPVGPRLLGAIAAAHADRPFSPLDVRDAARRVSEVARQLELEAITYRGGLDLGAAEIDHVWVVIADRVVDAAFPLRSPSFVAAVRAFVAGEVDDDELDRAAHPYSIRWRVVGSFPEQFRYRGQPLWSGRHHN